MIRYQRELVASRLLIPAFLVILLHVPVTQATISAASLNLCADSILLEVAAPEQIVSVSWLATDPELSNYAKQAGNYPNNHGRIEDLIALNPDFVFTGANTSAVDNALLARLGYSVVRLKPDRKLSDYESNLRLVAERLGREEQAETLISTLKDTLSEFYPARSDKRRPEAMIFQANGYIPGTDSLPAQLLASAGLGYPKKAAQNWPQGRFLSLEELIVERPSIIVMSSANPANPSLAELYLNHPALTRLSQRKVTAWQPKIVHLKERHFNCGSQYLAESLKAMAQARADYLAERQ